jgi:polar amino acid transport system substrate-binding protein
MLSIDKHVYKVLALFFFTGAIVYGLAGCSWNSKEQVKETPYIIAQPTTWQKIKLYGTEQSIAGFTADLLFEIAQTAKIKIRLVKVEPNLFKDLLQSEKIDAILTEMPVDSVSEQFYEFATPYFITGTVIVVPMKSPYTKADDLKNVQVGYDRGEGVDIVLKAKPSWLLKPYDNPSTMMEDLQTGQLDAVVMHLINALRINKSYFKSKIRILSPPLETQTVRLAVQKGHNHELIRLFNKGVQEYIKSGKYKELLDYWGIESYTPIQQ